MGTWTREPNFMAIHQIVVEVFYENNTNVKLMVALEEKSDNHSVGTKNGEKNSWQSI